MRNNCKRTTKISHDLYLPNDLLSNPKNFCRYITKKPSSSNSSLPVKCNKFGLYIYRLIYLCSGYFRVCGNKYRLRFYCTNYQYTVYRYSQPPKRLEKWIKRDVKYLLNAFLNLLRLLRKSRVLQFSTAMTEFVYNSLNSLPRHFHSIKLKATKWSTFNEQEFIIMLMFIVTQNAYVQIIFYDPCRIRCLIYPLRSI